MNLREGASLVCALQAAALLVVANAGATHVGWPVSRNQMSARASLERMERQLALDGASPLEPGVQREILRAVLAMADLERSLALPDPRITLLVAELMVGAEVPNAHRARALFERVIAESNDASVRARAFLGLARVSTRTEREAPAMAAFHGALRLSWSDERRALIYLERGLAHVRFRNMDAAIRDLRLTLALSRVDSIRFEASMVLAIAYERRQDLPSALAVVERALLGGRPKRIATTVLGSPWHSDLAQGEVSYGEALVAMGLAESHAEVDKKRRAYGAAVRHWERYLQVTPRRETSSEIEPFVLHAEHHLRACREALERLGPEPPEPEAE